jgi:hypothetical protein
MLVLADFAAVILLQNGVTPPVPTNSFFTPESLATLAGTTGMTWFVCSAMQSAFNFNPKWFALLVAEIFCFVAVFAFATNPSAITYLIAFVNGCLVYSSACGVNVLAGAPATREKGLVERKRSFLQSWF